MGKKRTSTLTVFCILSWVMMAFFLYSALGKLVRGTYTDEEIKQQKIALIDSQTPETIEIVGWVIEDTVAMLEIEKENYAAVNRLELIVVLLGIVGVYFMFNLKKIGFHLYVVYSILPLLLYTYFYGGLSMGLVLIIASAVISAIFVTVYAFQLKHMH